MELVKVGDHYINPEMVMAVKPVYSETCNVVLIGGDAIYFSKQAKEVASELTGYEYDDASLTC